MIKLFRNFILLIFLFCCFPAVASAESWGYVLAFYHYYQAEYPSPRNVVWIEKTPTTYRIWVRPQSSTYYRSKTIVTGGINYINDAGTVNLCKGGETVFMPSGQAKWEGTNARMEYNFCDGSFTTQNITGSYGLVSSISDCWVSSYFPSSLTLSSCKSQDVLLGEFTVGAGCDKNILQLADLVSYRNDSGCDCTPNGTEFDESVDD